VTTGILSARSRDINSGPYDNFLQTDAAINSGNSGGPLFNTAGEVVGVNTAIFSPSGGNVGIGFAVPSDVARAIVLDLQDDGTVSRGYLGVRVQHVGPELAEALGIEPGGVGDAGGALVAEVTEGSPAEAAGLVAGDVIVEVANAAVEDPRDLTFAVAELEPGSETTMTVMRDDGREQITVTIGEQPSDLFATAAPGGPAPGEPRLGVSVAPLDAETRDRAGIPEEVDGLLVAQVQGGTPAARAGLQQGDVIAEAGGAAVTQVSALRDAAAEAEEDDRPLLLRIWRGGGYNFVAIRFEDDAEDDDDADAG
jgi:serine protease Do